MYCLVVNPITVGNFAFLFNFTPIGRTPDSITRIMKFYASGNVPYVYMTSLIFDVIGRLYPKDQ